MFGNWEGYFKYSNQKIQNIVGFEKLNSKLKLTNLME